jgi:predicted P-loop ATPase
MLEKFDSFVEEIALRLCGNPNGTHSSKDELRFGRNGSLSVKLTGNKRGLWFNHEAGRGGDILALIRYKLGLDDRESTEWLRANFPARSESSSIASEATYEYRFPDGELEFQVVRRAGKRFHQRRPGPNGSWVNGLGKAKQLLYNLPEISKMNDEIIFVVEGEKDVETLRTHGLLGTCSPGGAAKPSAGKPYRSKWRPEFSHWLKDKTIAVIPDNDEAGLAHAESVLQSLNSVAKIVRLLLLPDLPPKGDVTDWLSANGSKERLLRLATSALRSPVTPRAPLQSIEEYDWQSQFQIGQKGQTLQTHANILIALRNDPAWKNTVVYDELLGRIMLLRPVPIAGDPRQDPFAEPAVYSDFHGNQALEYFQKTEFPTVRAEAVFRAVQQFAEETAVHPIREYLDGLEWDGIPRLHGATTDKGEIVEPFLPRYFGTKNDVYYQSVGIVWLVSMVARVFEPGCKVDQVVILEGPQGTGKSTACRILAGEAHFSDSLPKLGSKDAADHIRGKWLIEISELASFRRSDVEELKAFLSRQTENFRRPYDRHESSYKRQCVFVGTTNQIDYLHDETGARRFYPIATTEIDLEALDADRDQIFAEAVHHYRNKIPWHITDLRILERAKDEQRNRYEEDVWSDKILAVINGKDRVKITDILVELGVDQPRQDMAAKRRVSKTLRFNGWRDKRSNRERYWISPTALDRDT